MRPAEPDSPCSNNSRTFSYCVRASNQPGSSRIGQFVQLRQLSEDDDANARQATRLEQIVQPAERRARYEQRTVEILGCSLNVLA